MSLWLLGTLVVIAACGGAQTADVKTGQGSPPNSDNNTDTAVADRAKTGAKAVGKTSAPAHKVELAELPPVLMGKTMGREQLAAHKPTDTKLPTDAELEHAWARVFLRSNPGPFQYVAYEITARGKAGIISHTRGTMGRKDPIMRTELIDKDKLRRIMGRVRDLGAAQLADPGPLVPKPAKKPKKRAKSASAALDDDDDKRWPDRSAVPVYELSFRLGGKLRQVVVADPYSSNDTRYARFINAVREEVVGTVGDVGFHMGTSSDAKSGYLFVDSVPSADVWVDGTKLPDRTPVFAYPTSPGKHTVVLENELHDLRRTYKVTVKTGLTTSLEVDLR